MNRRFGRVRCLTLLALCSLALGGIQHRAAADARQNISVKIAGFYRWYMGQVTADKIVPTNRATMRGYTSRRLYKWLNSPAYPDFDADYFTQAQDFDKDWDKARISNVRVGRRVTTLKATLGFPKPKNKGIGQRVLFLKLVKESGAWKIDRVSDSSIFR